MKKYIATILVLLPSAALAAGGGGHDADATIADLLPHWGHFIAYVVLMYLLLRKSVPAAWNSRRVKIEDAVMRGERELSAAQAKLQEARDKLARLDSETAQLTESIIKETKLEAEIIIAEAKAQAERVLVQGKTTADAEQKSAERSVQNEIAAMVIERAKEILKDEMNESADKKYRDAAVSSVGTLLQ